MTHHIIELANGQIVHYWRAESTRRRGGRTWTYHIPVINFYPRAETIPAQTESAQ